jgi:hypothetical protein
MSPEQIESPRPAAGGSRDADFCLTANSVPLPQNATEAQGQVDRRTSTSGLSAAVRDVRIRLALDDIWHSLCPVSRHSEAAMLCVECEDFDGLEHHLSRVIAGVKSAAAKHKELRALRAAPTRETAQ